MIDADIILNENRPVAVGHVGQRRECIDRRRNVPLGAEVIGNLPLNRGRGLGHVSERQVLGIIDDCDVSAEHGAPLFLTSLSITQPAQLT
jgi:hypothetical protein